MNWLKKLSKDKDLKNAILIGTICVIAYTACYFCRNVLSIVTPYIIEDGFFSIEFIGLLSTTNMICYAFGQLANGIIGDKITAKYMISGGLVCAGLCNLIIPFSNIQFLAIIIYGMSGFFLSMLFAPITKVTAENTRPKYTIKCCLGFSFAALLGSPIAGMFAMIFNWKMVFIVCSFTLITIGVMCFITFTVLEKKEIVRYNQVAKPTEKSAGIKVLIENSIVKFSFVAILTGIVRTSVVFWIPTYLSQYLSFSTGAATSIFTCITLALSAAPYINIMLFYEKLLKRNTNRMLLFMFAASTFSFLLMRLIPIAVVNIVFLFIAIMTTNGASAMLWNVYCPGLKDTGMVSTATGYLDFLSYIAAAVANQLFANAVTGIGWGNLILIWAALMLIGVLISMPKRRNK